MAELTAASESTAARYQALLEVSESIASHQEISTLLVDLSVSLKRIVHFDGVTVTLYDPEERTITLLAVETNRNFPVPVGKVLPANDTPARVVIETGQPLYVAEIPPAWDDPYPAVHELMRAVGMRSYVILPMSTARRKFLGGLNFASAQRHAYTSDDIDFMKQVARQVAVALENVMNYESAAGYQRQLAGERDHLRLLLDVNNAVVSHLDTPELFRSISGFIRGSLGVEYLGLALYDEDRDVLRRLWLDYPDHRGQCPDDAVLGPDTPAMNALRRREAVIVTRNEFASALPEDTRDVFVRERVQQACCVPLISRNRALGTLNMASRNADTFSEASVRLLCEVAGQIAIALDNALSYKRIAELNARLSEEKLYLEDEIRTQFRFEEIIGRSAALVSVLRQVETVAPADSAVVLYGETGTGKELAARAIHDLSSRRNNTFVKLNCAAIPTGLLESELFGHEKGAFTGAIARRVGRFELASGGTLFLDEIGEIPLDLQPKLLRVLQEHEFERLGSSRTLRVDVRVVAATNRDLLQMVRDRLFRDDLYYRLNVFPIHMPALRDRRDDIPILVRHFTQECARRMRRSITSIPAESMDELVRYSWPGNVRELQNVIERAVIVSTGSTLQVPGDALTSPTAAAFPTLTLQDAERDHILEALRATNWVLAGPNGAAARLGVKRSTLQFRMKKLGIQRP